MWKVQAEATDRTALRARGSASVPSKCSNCQWTDVISLLHVCANGFDEPLRALTDVDVAGRQVAPCGSDDGSAAALPSATRRKVVSFHAVDLRVVGMPRSSPKLRPHVRA